MTWWQHIPEYLHPIACTVGFFSVYWYAIFFLFGLAAATAFVFWLRKKGIIGYSQEDIYDMIIFVFLGTLIGGRIGYVLFYNLDAFLIAPLRIILPYDFGLGVWTGISGMSYHGGLFGAILGLYWFARKRKLLFWPLADMLALTAPIAVFFGRLGNFFNRELYGRVTERFWGMYFPGTFPEGALRHPSELYEAFLEGMVLFLFLMFFRRQRLFPGALACAYLMGYAIVRFIAEYFREPDPQLGFLLAGLTLGQLFSVVMFLVGAVLSAWFWKKNHGTMDWKADKP